MITKNWVILTASLLGAVAGLLIHQGQAPIYVARALLGISGPAGTAPAKAAATGPADAAALQTQIKLIESPLVRGLVDQKLRSLGLPGLPARDDLPAVELSVRAVGKSNSIEIVCESSDPKMAATYCNALAEGFIDYHAQSRSMASNRSAKFLESRLTALRVKVEDAETRLKAYQQKSGQRENGERAEDKLRQLQVDLASAEADRKAKRSAYELALSDPANVPPPVPNESKSRKGGRKKARAADPARKMERERASAMARLRIESQRAEQREKALKAAYSQQSKLVADLSRSEVGQEVLQREVDLHRSLYHELLLKDTQAETGDSPFVVTRAEVPRSPAKPSLPLHVAGGLGTGTLLGLLYVFAAKQARGKRLKTPDEEGEATASLTATGSWVDIPEAAEANSPGGTGMRHPRSPAPVPEVWQPRVVVITSANPGEGKSVAVGNIAAALAETGKRVLMIDADLREPELHARFGAPNERGLSDLPAARREIRNMPLEGLVHPTAIKGLYLLPAGPGIVSMASLLHSDRIKALLERCLREFDTVLINAPPMQVPSDAGELARLADGAILVVRHSVTPEPSALAAKKRLVDDGIRIVGTVVSEEEAVPARPAAAPYQSSESILT